VTLLGVLVLAVLAHETTHWLILRTSGAPIRPAILTPKPVLLLSLGLGWSYDPRLVSREVRALSYLCAPLVELAIWLGGAAVLMVVLPPSSAALACAGLGLGMAAGNLWLPYGDGAGWRRLRRGAIAEEEKARGGVAGWPVGTGHDAEPGVGDRPVINVTGRVRHWPVVRRRDHWDTTVGPTTRR
jgi:hypothetical protein